jgi:hypothetical protein
VEASEGVHLAGWDRWEEERAGLYVMSRDHGGGLLRVETPILEVVDHAMINAMSAPGANGDASTMELRVGRLLIDHGRVTSTSQGSGRAGTLDVEASESVQIIDGQLESDTFGSGEGGLVHVKAPLVRLEEYGEVSSESQQVRLEVPGGGSSGTVALDVERLQVASRGRILTNARGEGRGGTIHIRASKSVELDSQSSDGVDASRIISLAEGDGPAGDIVIETPYLRVGSFSRIETTSNGSSGEGSPVRRAGRAGNILIRADDVLVESQAQIASDSRDPRLNEGPAGTVTLEVGRLRIPGNGEIRAATSTRGSGGQVVVHASESIVIDALDGGPHLGIETTTELSHGNAGSVEVDTPLLVLARGAGIGATTRGAGRAGSVTVRADRVHISGGSEIVSDAVGTGDAGPVWLDVGEALVVEGEGIAGPSGVFSRTAGPGRGAFVGIRAGSVDLRGGGAIAASSAGTGDAGDVDIQVANDLMADHGVVSTSAPFANGGNITVRAGDRIELHASRIAADVGDGRGGNVMVAPSKLLLLDASSITARAGAGRGGAIRIVADVVIQAQDAVVSASAGAAGIDGIVTIETPGYDFTTSLQALPAEFVDAVTLLHARCAERHGAHASFVVGAGPRGPMRPDELLPVAVREVTEDGRDERLVVLLQPTDEEGVWQGRCGG